MLFRNREDKYPGKVLKSQNCNIKCLRKVSKSPREMYFSVDCKIAYTQNSISYATVDADWKTFSSFFFSDLLWFCCYYHVLNVSCHNWLSFLLPDFAGFLKEVIHKSFDDFVDIGTTHYFNTILSQVFLLLNGFFSSANLKRLTISS